MEKIELLEKLVDVQEMHIELMNDYKRLQNCYKDLEHIKNVKIQQLNEEIEHEKEKFASAVEVNKTLNQQIAELKQQYEELQKLIPIELVGGKEERQI